MPSISVQLIKKENCKDQWTNHVQLSLVQPHFQKFNAILNMFIASQNTNQIVVLLMHCQIC